MYYMATENIWYIYVYIKGVLYRIFLKFMYDYNWISYKTMKVNQNIFINIRGDE